jgi:GntR family transcriptional regulator
MIHFYLDSRSSTSPYLQIVEQVKRALLLGHLQVGDQLPTVKEVVASIAINPNTVLKAYRQLEQQGIVAGRPGIGTFIVQTLATSGNPELPRLREALGEWLERAEAAGIDDDTIAAMFEEARRTRTEVAP